ERQIVIKPRRKSLYHLATGNLPVTEPAHAVTNRRKHKVTVPGRRLLVSKMLIDVLPPFGISSSIYISKILSEFVHF
ncbi:MAG: hypothetical protein IJH47_10080, partial [Oscillospiraceae bacterium]|nr:hypothetical protein [Oscillospiraceae bacterium]